VGDKSLPIYNPVDGAVAFVALDCGGSEVAHHESPCEDAGSLGWDRGGFTESSQATLSWRAKTLTLLEVAGLLVHDNDATTYPFRTGCRWSTSTKSPSNIRSPSIDPLKPERVRGAAD
jgi:hypothetical protein